MTINSKTILSLCGALIALLFWTTAQAKQAPNIIYILTDDQRYDELGFMNPALDTPNMNRLAKEGTHFRNAFVTTALCSPSRASILTGLYMHNHGVVDNNKPPREGTRYFPEYLQKAGYTTGFFGKWHMGEHLSSNRKMDDPQPGFDRWVSFAGQGHYYPRGEQGELHTLNVDGKTVPQKGYITDELTDYVIDWLDTRPKDKPFFVYLSHKAVHANFLPAERHRDQYSDRKAPSSSKEAMNEENYNDKPMWVKNQRNSWHGVDFPYHSSLDVQSFKLEYDRTLTAVDDSLGRILKWLEDNGHDKNTVVMFMGDNGFMFGEHGLIDKRNAYEESMRVPLLAWGGDIKANHKVDEITANIDIAATMLDIAGTQIPEHLDGESFYPLSKGKRVKNWRSNLLYEYYWEFNFPSTPTTFALRTEHYKFITYHGIWDTEELYDLKQDPREMRNLINDPRYLSTIADLRAKLFNKLAASSPHAMQVPFTEKFSTGAVLRHKSRSKAAEFPENWLRDGTEKDLTEFFIPDAVRAKAETQEKVKK